MPEAGQSVYRTGQFARRARVTERTLRFYDRAGLLSPSDRSEAGYRLYTDADLATLQQILALKFLGFSLEEIRRLRHHGAPDIGDMLERQKAMLVEKRQQIDAIVAAIDGASAKLATGRNDWDAIVGVIEVMQMDQTEAWQKKYFSDEQLATMGELARSSYSPEAAAKLAKRAKTQPWTELDQERVSAQWKHVYAEAERLAAAGADPGGEEAQAIAGLKAELLSAFTQNDPDVIAGLQAFWTNHNALPQQQQPLSEWKNTPAAAEFLERASAIYAGRQQDNG